MKYFGQKNKEAITLKVLFIILAGAFCFVFGVTQYIHYKEKKALTSETWAIAPENGFVMKMQKIPFTIEERNAEYKAHVRDFLTHWFQFDQYTFMDNMNYGSNLIDKESRTREINKYREEHTLERLQESDYILTIEIKDITIDVTQRPYKGSFSLIQTLRSKEDKNKRIIEGVFNIEDSEGRSFENPHAAMIFNFQKTRQEIIKN